MDRFEFTPWVIDLGYRVPGSHPYAGPYLLTKRVDQVRPWQRGVSVATFKTRAEARAVLPTAKKAFPKARVIRARITVEEYQF